MAPADAPSLGVMSVLIRAAEPRDVDALGVGAALVAEAQRWASTHGVARLYAPILTDNATATRFYESCGYLPLGTTLTSYLR